MKPSTRSIARHAARVISRIASLGACASAFALLCGWMPAAAQTIDLATSPLYSGFTAAPNVAIVASFEFPTFGQAYLNVTYDATQTYVGYFDPTKCYVYSGDSVRIGSNDPDPNGYFYVSIIPQTVSHTCAASFSGSYLNYATITAADEFRYALTGGTRVLEAGPNSGTILQRAYLSGCNTNDSNCNSFSPLSTNAQVYGIPDFYGNTYTFPRLTAPPGALGGLAVAGAYVNNCKTAMYLSLFTGGNCFSPKKELGIYNVRVNVCDASEGPTRTDLCLYYPSGGGGKYKPVGVVQKNASAMRFSIFGYLVDRTVGSYTVPSACADNVASPPTGIWNRCRVGGVLRAPMKYVGPLTYDANGVSSNNPCAEINADGTLNDDPEGNAGCPNGISGASVGGKYSGFINYLTRFGSATQAGTQTGTGGAGEYKRYDTLGEMYYEAIRYYQKLTPTPETYQAQNGVAYPNQVAGYFPVVTNWTDPIIAACSSNYILALADAFTFDDVYLPGYNGSPTVPVPGAAYRKSSRVAEGGLDAVAWTQKIGALEAGTSSVTSGDVHAQMYFYTGTDTSTTATLQASTGIQGAPAGSQRTGAYFDAGAAYWANTNDIRTDLAGVQTIKTIAVDVGSGSSPVWDRQLYLMGKYGGFNVPTISRSDSTQANPFYATNPANPSGPGVRSNSEWESATGSAYPANYLFAKDPKALISGLQSAFARVASQTGTAAGGSVTSSNLNYGAAGTYVSQFSPARWSGTVLYETVSSVNGVIAVGTTPLWDAGALLTTRCGSTSPYSSICTDASIATIGNRNIVTTITSSASVRSAVNFTYANLATDSNYTQALNVNPVTGVLDNLGQQRVNYLRGYRADESSTTAFRTRDSVMGDIVNSAPIYVGAPSTGITDVAYQTFYAANAARTPAVYVGANDGMLHAFNATTGAELFAYIPGAVSSYLGDLTNPGYGHDPFVDAIPTVQEAKVNGSYKTVLVSGTGAGAQAVFALDVTDPTAFGPSKVLFEFTDADDHDLGNVVSAPLIVKLQTGTTTSGGVTSPTYGYFAAVTSYNDRRPLCRSPGNTSLLTLLGAVLSSIPACTNNSQGDTYLVQDPANRGILYLLSLDRTVGTAWTLGANYYKFYFPAFSTSARNGLGPVSALPNTSGDGTAAALYFGDLQGQLWRLNTVGAPSAWAPSLGTVGAARPIFNAVDANNNRQPITARPELATGTYGSTLVIFGTGAYLGQTDLSTSYAQQSEYGLIDTNGGTLISRSSDLQPRFAYANSGVVTVYGYPFQYIGGGSGKGWYIDFPGTSSGERMVNKAAVAPGLLTFTSLTLASSACGTGGGYVYQLNPLTGLPSSGSGTAGGYVSTVGIPGPPVIVDLSVLSGQSRGTGEQINQKTRTTLVSGTSGGIAGLGLSTQKAPPVGRVNWREITNFNDMPKTP